MDSKVDMTYRFVWNEEPSDAQLERLMQEVGDAVRQENEALNQEMKAKMALEMKLNRAKLQL